MRKRHSKCGAKVLEHFLNTMFLMPSGPGAFMGLSLLIECSICSIVMSGGSGTGLGYSASSGTEDWDSGGGKEVASAVLFSSLVDATEIMPSGLWI